jgi:hypothetical protein
VNKHGPGEIVESRRPHGGFASQLATAFLAHSNKILARDSKEIRRAVHHFGGLAPLRPAAGRPFADCHPFVSPMPVRLPTNPKNWRDRAEEARATAELMTDPEAKRIMLVIAASYSMLANLAEERQAAAKKIPLRRRPHTRSQRLLLCRRRAASVAHSNKTLARESKENPASARVYVRLAWLAIRPRGLARSSRLSRTRRSRLNCQQRAQRPPGVAYPNKTLADDSKEIRRAVHNFCVGSRVLPIQPVGQRDRRFQPHPSAVSPSMWLQLVSENDYTYEKGYVPRV